MAEPYSYDIGFAFFAARLGYSIDDYDKLTPVQRALIIKELELKEVKEDLRINAAVTNAIYNTNRGKNKPFKPLWKKKKKGKKADISELKEKLQVVKSMEEKAGKDWVEKIYRANNMVERRKNGK